MRRSIIFWAAVAFLLFVAWALSPVILRQNGLLPAPYHYTAAEYTPAQGVLCPGDELVYTVGIVVEKAPVVTGVIYTVTNDMGYNVERDTEIEWAIHEHPLTITGERRMVIPALPPGRYTQLGARIAEGADVQVHRVVFTVPEGCV